MKKQSATEKLEKAYFDMLEYTHYSKITVSDIIRKAETSRTTFYRHYVDIFDMHKKIADKLAFSIIKECAERVIKAKSEEDYFESLLEIMNSQEKYIILLSSENGSRFFFEAMISNAQKFITDLSANFNEHLLFRLRFMTVAMVGVYVRDMLENREHNLNYIKICKKIINYNDVFGGQNAKSC